jgi:hypothetical protein
MKTDGSLPQIPPHEPLESFGIALQLPHCPFVVLAGAGHALFGRHLPREMPHPPVAPG